MSRVGYRNAFMEYWCLFLSQPEVSKTDMDKIMMDYMLTRGYVDVAEKFSVESRTKHVDCAVISSCVALKNAFMSGNVEQALERLEPEMFDSESQLGFDLLQLQVIEILRSGNTHKAVDVAQVKLAPMAEKNGDLLVEVERTMALLAFDDMENCPFADELLSNTKRLKTANAVNRKTLQNIRHQKDPKILDLLKVRRWLETSEGIRLR